MAKERLVTRENLGAWVLKCDPQVWDLHAFLAFGEDLIDEWSVAPNYRAEMMRKGDPVVFWVSGPKGGEVTYRGVWGVGHVLGTPSPSAELTDDELQESLWLDLKHAKAPALDLPTDIRLLKHPVPADIFTADPVLAGCEIVRAQQLANPAFLNKAEFAALKRIVKDWPKAPVAEQTVATVSARGAGFGTAEQNRKIELAAMAAVAKRLEKDGYAVADVSHSNLGWDITAVLAGAPVWLRHVEVKGVAGSLPRVLLTNNEFRAMHEDRYWELAVVTNALTHAHVEFYSRKRASKASAPYAWRVDLA